MLPSSAVYPVTRSLQQNQNFDSGTPRGRQSRGPQSSFVSGSAKTPAVGLRNLPLCCSHAISFAVAGRRWCHPPTAREDHRQPPHRRGIGVD